MHAGATGHACKAFANVASGSNEAKARRAALALVQAGAPAALVVAAHEAVRAGHAGALQQTCRGRRQPRGRQRRDRGSAGAGRRARGPGRGGARGGARPPGGAEACAALASLAAGSDEIETALLQAGAPAALVATALEAVRAGHALALQHACEALVNLARGSDESKASPVQAGAPAALVAAASEAVRAGNMDAFVYARLALDRLGVDAPQAGAGARCAVRGARCAVREIGPATMFSARRCCQLRPPASPARFSRLLLPPHTTRLRTRQGGTA